MPDRTFTPDAVVVPLQYAVAPNVRRVPGAGSGPTSAAGPSRRPKRESRIRVSYRNTKAVTTTERRETALRQQESREISTTIGPAEVREARRQRLVTSVGAAARSRDRA